MRQRSDAYPLLNPFATILELVSKHGYARSSFALVILAALFAVPVYLWRRDDEAVDQPRMAVDIGPEILERLSRIRVALGADVVLLNEFFRTPTSNLRGFDPNGVRVPTYESRSSYASARSPLVVLGDRYRLSPSPSDPDGAIAREIEVVERAGFFLVPDTRTVTNGLPGAPEVLGLSYYIIGGYNVTGLLILAIVIGFARERVLLVEGDLRPYMDDVQEIVALLLSRDEL